MNTLVWISIIIFAVLINKKQKYNPKIWKVIVATYIGLFSFSINLDMFGVSGVKLAILPLGVLILYLVLKRKNGRWETYRPYAWLGFGSNYLFLVAAFLVVPLHQFVYPKNELSTYISAFDDPSIIVNHSSGKQVTLNKEILEEQISNWQSEAIQSEQWYWDSNFSEDEEYLAETKNESERFPYALMGALPKRGSGFFPVIYIEEDGKGILVSIDEQQFYFRGPESILRDGE